MTKAALAKPVDSLEIADLERNQVWQFTASDGRDETLVRPVTRLPVTSLTGKVVGSQIRLANGSRVWALIGNVDASNSRLTEHFLSVSVFRDGRRFALARYFDPDYADRGPLALAEFLELPIDDVFPISYDIRSCAVGAPDALTGSIEKEPRERLTRAQVIALAVPKKLDR